MGENDERVYADASYDPDRLSDSRKKKKKSDNSSQSDT